MLVRLLELASTIEKGWKGQWRHPVLGSVSLCCIAVVVAGFGFGLMTIKDNGLNGDSPSSVEIDDWEAAAAIAQSLPLVLVVIGFIAAISYVSKVIANHAMMQLGGGGMRERLVEQGTVQAESNGSNFGRTQPGPSRQAQARLSDRLQRTRIGGITLAVTFAARALLWVTGALGLIHRARYPAAPACGPGSEAAAALSVWIQGLPWVMPMAVTISEPVAGIVAFLCIAAPSGARSGFIQ